jgi:nucleotide-binding universal stress UspA family protein
VRTIVQRCPRPLLAVPGERTELRRAVLAYDGGATADEALYVTTYLAARWQTEVIVLTLQNARNQSVEPQAYVRDYLQSHGVEAAYEVRFGDLAENVMEMVESEGCDVIIIGGYGRQPVLELMLGSGLNEVLRAADVPVLICR